MERLAAVGQAQEDLRFIREMMEETRRVTLESHHGFFLWGAIFWTQVVVTYGLAFLAVRGGNDAVLEWIPWVWVVLSNAGFVYTVWFVLKARRLRPPITTLSDRVIGYTWLSALVATFLLSYASAAASELYGYEYNYQLGMAIVAAILACPLAVTGGVYDVKPLRNLAIAFWVGAAVMVLVPRHWAALVFGVVVGTGFIVTGLALRRAAEARLH